MITVKNTIPYYPRKVWAAKMARDCILKLGINQLPIDPFYITNQLKIPVLTLEQASELTKFPRNEIISGRDSDIRFCNGYYKIIYNERAYPPRISFSISHEIGHYTLKHLESFQETRLAFDGLTEREYEVLEGEADQFAAELLMPAPVLLELQILEPDEIAEVCKVSKGAATNRSNYLKNYVVYKHEIKGHIQLKGLFRDYIEMNQINSIQVAEQTSTIKMIL